MPAEYCELACSESCERVSSLTLVGEDILLVFVDSTEKFPAKLIQNCKLQRWIFLSFNLGQFPASLANQSPIPHFQFLSLVVFNSPSASKCLVPASFACSISAQSLSPAAFWNLSLTRSLITHSPPVSNSAHSTSRPHSFTPSGLAPKPVCAVVVCFTDVTFTCDVAS